MLVPGTDLLPLIGQLPYATACTIAAASIEAGAGGPAGKSSLLFSVHWQLGLERSVSVSSVLSYSFELPRGKVRLYCFNNPIFALPTTM